MSEPEEIMPPDTIGDRYIKVEINRDGSKADVSVHGISDGSCHRLSRPMEEKLKGTLETREVYHEEEGCSGVF